MRARRRSSDLLGGVVVGDPRVGGAEPQHRPAGARRPAGRRPRTGRAARRRRAAAAGSSSTSTSLDAVDAEHPHALGAAAPRLEVAVPVERRRPAAGRRCARSSRRAWRCSSAGAARCRRRPRGAAPAAAGRRRRARPRPCRRRPRRPAADSILASARCTGVACRRARASRPACAAPTTRASASSAVSRSGRDMPASKITDTVSPSKDRSIRSPGPWPGSPHIHSSCRSRRSWASVTPKSAAACADADPGLRLQVGHQRQQPRQPLLVRRRPRSSAHAAASGRGQPADHGGDSSGGSSAARAAPPRWRPRRASQPMSVNVDGQHAVASSARPSRRSWPAPLPVTRMRADPARSRDRGRRPVSQQVDVLGSLEARRPRRTTRPSPAMRESRKLRGLARGRGRSPRRTSGAATTARPTARGCGAPARRRRP